ncbi:hypothetical protein IJI18_00685 [Candidatus Saccharibacteria bacterium]|nr:hypothetical protein [Candidatus Saccharibacteria bacterium]
MNEKQYIPIYFGDDTDFNDRTFCHVTLETDLDLSAMSAVLYLGHLQKEYEIEENAFDIQLSATETKTLPFGEVLGKIALFDSNHRRRTITSEIPFWVSQKVAEALPVDITLTVPEESEVAYVTLSAQAIAQINTHLATHDTQIAQLQSADTSQAAALQSEAQTRAQADSDLSARINALNFIQFVQTLPATGDSKYIYAVPQEETDLQEHPIVVLYIYQSQWYAIGAFSTNIDPATLATKTELQTLAATVASSYVGNTQKGAAGGVASLDGNGQITAGQIPYATSSVVGGIKHSFDAATGTWTILTENV